MFKNKKVISIIPARKNSKNLKNKNNLKLNNYSLVELAILSSKKSSIIDETIVTTDSKKIFNIAKKFKCKVIRRPIYLGKDNINANQVIAHAIKKNNLHEEYIIVYLQPTSPFRNHKHINKAFNILKNYKTYNLVSVKPVNEILYKSYILKNYLKPKFKDLVNSNRQNLNKIYCANGAIYIFSNLEFLRNNKKIPNKRLVPYIMNEIESIDINSKYDFNISKFLKKYIVYK
tara:strand:- start:7192 stop:7884 length:693 start_codon:yes stop_codon:yes gene_type:complete